MPAVTPQLRRKRLSGVGSPVLPSACYKSLSTFVSSQGEQLGMSVKTAPHTLTGLYQCWVVQSWSCALCCFMNDFSAHISSAVCVIYLPWGFFVPGFIPVWTGRPSGPLLLVPELGAPVLGVPGVHAAVR